MRRSARAEWFVGRCSTTIRSVVTGRTESTFQCRQLDRDMNRHIVASIEEKWEKLLTSILSILPSSFHLFLHSFHSFAFCWAVSWRYSTDEYDNGCRKERVWCVGRVNWRGEKMPTWIVAIVVFHLEIVAASSSFSILATLCQLWEPNWGKRAHTPPLFSGHWTLPFTLNVLPLQVDREEEYEEKKSQSRDFLARKRDQSSGLVHICTVCVYT